MASWSELLAAVVQLFGAAGLAVLIALWAVIGGVGLLIRLIFAAVTLGGSLYERYQLREYSDEKWREYELSFEHDPTAPGYVVRAGDVIDGESSAPRRWQLERGDDD